jgi:hypothetical protein
MIQFLIPTVHSDLYIPCFRHTSGIWSDANTYKIFYFKYSFTFEDIPYSDCRKKRSGTWRPPIPMPGTLLRRSCGMAHPRIDFYSLRFWHRSQHLRFFRGMIRFTRVVMMQWCKASKMERTLLASRRFRKIYFANNSLVTLCSASPPLVSPSFLQALSSLRRVEFCSLRTTVQ